MLNILKGLKQSIVGGIWARLEHKKGNLLRLTHKYSYDSNRYYIRTTSMNIEEVDWLCSFILSKHNRTLAKIFYDMIVGYLGLNFC